MNPKRIALISDLHLNHWSKRKNLSQQTLWQDILHNALATKPDLIVLAGDVADGYNPLPEFIEETVYGVPLLYIPGNHDCYHHELPAAEVIRVGDVIGATLWTNFAHATLPPAKIYQAVLDSRLITDASSNKVTDLFYETLPQLLVEDVDVVVTHFPPSMQSVSEKFRGDPINPFFVNDLDMDIKKRAPNIKLWLCGHVHHRHVYTIGNTLVACNPMGYPGENYVDYRNYRPMVFNKRDDGAWELEES